MRLDGPVIGAGPETVGPGQYFSTTTPTRSPWPACRSVVGHPCRSRRRGHRAGLGPPHLGDHGRTGCRRTRRPHSRPAELAAIPSHTHSGRRTASQPSRCGSRPRGHGRRRGAGAAFRIVRRSRGGVTPEGAVPNARLKLVANRLWPSIRVRAPAGRGHVCGRPADAARSAVAPARGRHAWSCRCAGGTVAPGGTARAPDQAATSDSDSRSRIAGGEHALSSSTASCSLRPACRRRCRPAHRPRRVVLSASRIDVNGAPCAASRPTVAGRPAANGPPRHDASRSATTRAWAARGADRPRWVHDEDAAIPVPPRHITAAGEPVPPWTRRPRSTPAGAAERPNQAARRGMSTTRGQAWAPELTPTGRARGAVVG